MPLISLATSSKPVHHLFQVIVDLDADDEGHGVALPAFARNNSLQPCVVELIGVFFDPDDLLASDR